MFVCLLAAQVHAQDSRPPSRPSASLDDLVWTCVDAANASDAGPALKELAARKDFDLAALLRILDGCPPRPPAPRGLQLRIPFTIPVVNRKTDFSLFVPEGAGPKAKFPLWISSHGTGSNGEDALHGILPVLRDRGVIVVAPSEAADLHGKGWGWQHRERLLHIELIDLLAKQYPIDRDSVVISGWSRGGHAAFDLGCRYSDRLAAAGPVIGSVIERDRSLLVNLHATRVHAINGAQDQQALVDGVVEAMRRLTAMRYDATSYLDPARGHTFFQDQLPDLADKMLAARRRAAPRELHVAVRELEYGRHFYVRVKVLAHNIYRPGNKIVIPGIDKMTSEEAHRAHVDFIESRTPRLDLTFSDNEFRITTKLVSQFDLYLPLALVDTTKPVNVLLNGTHVVKNRRYAPPLPARVLELLREFGGSDPAFRFVDKLSFSVN